MRMKTKNVHSYSITKASVLIWDLLVNHVLAMNSLSLLFADLLKSCSSNPHLMIPTLLVPFAFTVGAKNVIVTENEVAIRAFTDAPLLFNVRRRRRRTVIAFCQ